MASLTTRCGSASADWNGKDSNGLEQSHLATNAFPPMESRKELKARGGVHTELAHRLGVDILKGRYRPGDSLPTELEATPAWKISRSAYREALRILSAKGMVEARTKAGTWVTRRSRWNILDPDVLRWMFETEPTSEFIAALFELRLITEPAAAVLAAQRRSDFHVRDMGRALETMARATLATEQGRQADLDFHRILLAATGNEALTALTSTICAAVAWSTRYKQRAKALPRDPVPDHYAVFEAIARKNKDEARWRMEALVHHALEDTKSSMSDPGNGLIGAITGD